MRNILLAAFFLSLAFVVGCEENTSTTEYAPEPTISETADPYPDTYDRNGNYYPNGYTQDGTYVPNGVEPPTDYDQDLDYQEHPE
jgi:hypothetical protein